MAPCSNLMTKLRLQDSDVNSILLSSVLKALILLPTEWHYSLHLLDFNHISIYIKVNANTASNVKPSIQLYLCYSFTYGFTHKMR